MGVLTVHLNSMAIKGFFSAAVLQALLFVGSARGQACVPCMEVTEGPLKGSYSHDTSGFTSPKCSCVYKGPDDDMYCMEPNGLYNTIERDNCTVGSLGIESSNITIELNVGDEQGCPGSINDLPITSGTGKDKKFIAFGHI